MVAPCLSAATWHAASTGLADVATAVNLAADGDTVTVPAGTATWTAQLTITKNITLQGAGVGQTIIVDKSPRGRSDQHLILVTLSKDRPVFRLTGFEFRVGMVTGGQPSSVLRGRQGSWKYAGLRPRVALSQRLF